MTTFNKLKRKHYAVIFNDGRVEVREAESDSVQGRVYFTCKTKAFKAATDLIESGLICVRRKGWMVAPKGFVEAKTSYYLGALILKERDKDTQDYKDEVFKSKLIHDVCQARVSK